MKMTNLLKYVIHVITHTYNYVFHFERTQDECYKLFGIAPEEQRRYGYVTLKDYVGSYKSFRWSQEARCKIYALKHPKIKIITSRALLPGEWLMTTDQRLIEELQDQAITSTLPSTDQNDPINDPVTTHNVYDHITDPRRPRR